MDLSIHGNALPIEVVSNELSIQEYIQKKTSGAGREDSDDPFFIVDLGRVIELYQDWVTALPTVTPFYAVKCNNDPALLKTLAALGTGFDCASKTEMKSVLDLGVSPKHIIYANPCKQISHLKYASRKSVDVMTFDNEYELYKVHKYFPCAKLVVRIRADDPEALCQLGMKFGCSVPEGKVLLGIAKGLGLNVVGVSFHVGSGSQSPKAYEVALKMAAELFEAGYEMGYQFSLLDIGGGFPGDKDSKEVFQRVASAINSSLTSLFNSYQPGLTVIAEPGRYFACSTHALAVNVTSKRTTLSEEGWKHMYYVNDGVYGSFNCIIFDHVTPTPLVLKEINGPCFPASLWGPSCDGLDTLGEAFLPELDIGDWIYFDNMGAYTISASSTFNGFLRPKVYYYVKKSKLDEFRDLMEPVPSSSSCPIPIVLTANNILSSLSTIELVLEPSSVEVC